MLLPLGILLWLLLLLYTGLLLSLYPQLLRVGQGASFLLLLLRLYTGRPVLLHRKLLLLLYMHLLPAGLTPHNRLLPLLPVLRAWLLVLLHS